MRRSLPALAAASALALALPTAASAVRPDDGGGRPGGATAAQVVPVPGGDTGGAGAGAVPTTTTPAPAVPATTTTGVDPNAVAPMIVVPNRRTIPGRVARLRVDGRAAIPRGAPRRVRSVIAAGNRIVGKPYLWGGGHSKLADRGYDCSGAVGFALIRSGLMASTATSGMLARWAVAGGGRWMTVYANRGHVYLEVAGLRLDTSAVADPGGRGGVRWRPVVGRRPGFHARHVAGL